MTELATLKAHAGRFGSWLREAALPLWRARGFSVETGFAETVATDGVATTDHRRSRVHPRQIYCFAEAGRRGWQGDWQTPVEAGLAYFDAVYQRPDGTYGNLASAEGEMAEDRFDLYNQAFALLGFASVALAVPERKVEMRERAAVLLDCLETSYRHAEAGFEEASPPVLPLRSNPHMHLFEAALAWEAVDQDASGRWAALADELAGLCRRRFVDPRSGAVREYFDSDWSALADDRQAVEPGHQFEWAWLLTRWAERRDRLSALESETTRLFEIGTSAGIDANRGVAVMRLDTAFEMTDRVARLWSQTEWLKAAVRLACHAQGEERRRYLASAVAACVALAAFLDTPLEGLWWDKQAPEGSFVREASPASSFYHIVCAIYELEDCMKDLAA